jgi:hypothetical protein
MAVLQHFVTSPSRFSAAARAGRAARRLGSAGAVALLLTGILAIPGTASAQNSPSLAGTWRLSCPNRQGGVRQITLRIEQNGAHLSGSFSGPRRSGKLSGTVQGDQVRLRIGAGGRTITLTGTSDGNSITIQRPRGGSCSGTRQ